MAKRILAIDADSLCYAAGFATERTSYVARDAEGRLNGPFASRVEALKVGHDVFTRSEVQPWEAARNALEGPLHTWINQARERYGDLEPRIFITGSSNYRDRLPSRLPYKWNRAEKPKPAHLTRLREHLVKVHDALKVHWMEADDYVAILATEQPDTVVCSIDKDLLQVPGVHMIPDKGFMSVTERSALLRLYVQILAGDNTDGVPGCYRTGDTGATKLLKEVASNTKGSIRDVERALWSATLEQYRNSVKKYGAETCGYEDPEREALTTARFVYLLRKHPANPHAPDLWEPPGA
jgi:hypothetical protein